MKLDAVMKVLHTTKEAKRGIIKRAGTTGLKTKLQVQEISQFFEELSTCVNNHSTQLENKLVGKRNAMKEEFAQKVDSLGPK